MTEVRSDNFQALLPDILREISTAKFIAIDTEFTALYVGDALKPSLFDNGKDRYKKLRTTVKHTIPIQIGVSVFHFNSMYNTYQVKTFTFYIWPKPIMSVNRLIQFQASSFQFLSRHNFDYNKLIFNGIPFLNNEEEAQVIEDFKKKIWPLDSSIEQYIDDITTDIKNWYTKAKENDSYIVETSSDNLKYDVDAWYHVHSHLQRTYSGIWTRVNEDNMLVLEKVSLETLKENQRKDNLKTRTINSALGFTHVFRALIAAKKPIIGHNLLMDLLLLQSTFGENLPNSYTTFKKRIHEDFPQIIDTKCLSFLVRRMVHRDKEWKQNTLKGLNDFFLKGNGKELNFKTPLIKSDLGDKEYYHHAGWDSYYTGAVFIQLAHYAVTKRLKMSSNQARDIMCSEYFEAAKPVLNQINLIRSVNSHMNLCGPDPISTRPPWLVAISMKGELDITQLSEALETYGFVEIQAIHNQRAIISVSSKQDASDILENFKKSNDFKIRIYRSFLHHRLALPIQIVTASVCLLGAIGIVSRVCKLY